MKYTIILLSCLLSIALLQADNSSNTFCCKKEFLLNGGCGCGGGGGNGSNEIPPDNN